MRKSLAYLLLSIICLGCKKEHKLTFEAMQYGTTDCANCPNIQINVPYGLDNSEVTQNINSSIREELIYALKFGEAENVGTIEEAMQSFTNSFQNLKEKFEDEAVGWEADIKGKITYEDENIITVRLDSYTFTGGAHGYGSTSFLNFEKKRGTELDNHQLFKDYKGFEALTEKLFRKKEGIPQEENINATGFMFNGERFHLSENIGYVNDGIQLVYNPYEVASYADGPIVMTVPFEMAGPFLKFKNR